ncbi:unnamed protein product [Ectocarpus sp. CCAP 1310/34]|nr:unnamed protein product [Ectocarpus sp. CCAP 1310/34]
MAVTTRAPTVAGTVLPTPGEVVVSGAETAAPTAAPTSAPTIIPEVQEVAASAAAALSTVSVAGVVASSVVTAVGGTTSASASVVAGGTGQAATQSTFRNPSSTMALVLTSQIQFLATLSFVDDTGVEGSALSGLTKNLRWVNLWPSQSFSEGVASWVLCNEPEPTSGEDDDSEEDGDSTQRGISWTVISDVGSFLFMGNLALFAGFFVIIFSVHILLASAVEAYWLAKQRARNEIPRALGGDLSTSGSSTAWSGTRAIQSPQLMEHQALPSWDSTGRNDSTNVQEAARTNTRAGSSIGQVSECRELSQSAWLHYPHLELVFLFFAFEGAVTSQVSALRSTSSSTVFYAAVATLTGCNLSRIATMSILGFILFDVRGRVRVRSDALIVFTSNKTDEGSTGKSTLYSKMVTGLKKDSSLFAWADKGHWNTVQTADEDARRDADWFRIGFEPLYADFTQAGSWFTVYTLIEWATLACIAVLVDNSAVQCGLFCALHSMTFILLVVCKPFANSVLNTMGAIVMLTDAVCMGMLALSAGTFRMTAAADRIDIVVMVAQHLCIAVLVVPLYVDTLLLVWGAIRNRRGPVKTRDNAAQRAEREFINRRTLRLWGRTWFNMVGSNVFACVRDTREGIRDPTGSRRQDRLRAGQIGPYPEWSLKNLRAPVPIDLPRRNFGGFDWYGGQDDDADAITDQPASGRRRKWKRGPAENDYPIRRSSYSLDSTIAAVSMEEAGQTSSPRSAGISGSDERSGSNENGPIEDNLSFRHSNILVPSAVVVDRRGDAGPLTGREYVSHAQSISAKRRHGSHGRQCGAGLIEDDLPRRRIGLAAGPEILDDAVHEQGIDENEAGLEADEDVQGPRRRRGRRRGEPAGEDFPRRRPSVWSVSGFSVDHVDNTDLQSVPEHDNDLEHFSDVHGPQNGQSRTRRGPVEDSLPRRRFCSSSIPMSSLDSSDEADRQPLPEYGNDLEAVVDDGSLHGWGHRQGRHLEDDLPHRRSGYSAASGFARHLDEDLSLPAMHNLDTNMWPASVQQSARSDRTHKWGEPVQDDLPRRRSVFCSASTASMDSIHGSSRQAVPKDGLKFDVDETPPQRRGSCPHGGPVQNDLSSRRPSFSFRSTTSAEDPPAIDGLQAVPEHGGDAPPLVVNRSWQRERATRGGPFEDGLPRRRSVFLSTSMTSVDSADEPFLQSVLENRNYRGSSGGWAGRQRGEGRAQEGLVEDDVPRRRSWFSFFDMAAKDAKAPDVQAGHEQDDGALSIVADNDPREGQGRKPGGDVEELPHRCPIFSSTSGYSTDNVDVPDLQRTHDDKSFLGVVSNDHGQHGRSRDRGALIVDEFPRRRLTYDSGMEARVDYGDISGVPMTTDHEDDTSADSETFGIRGRWAWNGRKPIQDNIPHRRPGVSKASVVGVEDSGMSLTPERDCDRETVLGSFGGIDAGEGRPIGTGRKASGDVGRSSEPSRTYESPGLFGIPWGFTWGKPIAVDLPRRHSRNSSGSTHRMGLASKGSFRQDGSFCNRRDSSQFSSFGNTAVVLAGKQSSEPSNMDESKGLFRRSWGFPREKPTAVDLPRRYSGSSFDSSHGTGLSANKALSRQDGGFSTGPDASHLLGSQGDIMTNPADRLGGRTSTSSAIQTARPAFLGWAHAEHKPIEIDVPRRRGSQLSFSLEGGGELGTCEAAEDDFL